MVAANLPCLIVHLQVINNNQTQNDVPAPPGQLVQRTGSAAWQQGPGGQQGSEPSKPQNNHFSDVRWGLVGN